MSRISRAQTENLRNLDDRVKKSSDTKDAMKAKYARNLAMMESLRSGSLVHMGCNEEVGDETVLSTTSSQGSGVQTRSDDNSDSASPEKNKTRDEERKSPGLGGQVKPADQEYIRACLDSAVELKKAIAEKEEKRRKRRLARDAGEQCSDSSSSNSQSDMSAEDWLSGNDHVTDLPHEAAVMDFTQKFRRDSLNSFQHIEDAADRSLCSTEEDELVRRPLPVELLHRLRRTLNHLQKYENFNRCVAIVLFYVIGVVVYTFLEDNWSLSDTVYFISISITTVGFGDMVPTSDISKLFTMFYVLLGLVVIFSYLNYFAETILQYAEDQAVKLAEKSSKRRRKREAAGQAVRSRESEGISFAKYHRKLFFYVMLVIVTIFVGSVFYMYNEDWTFVNAIYFSFIATLTIGYGDPVLQNPSSRTFSIFYVLFSVMAIAMALGNIGALKLAMRQERKKFDMLHKKLDLTSIIAMDDNGDGVDRIEFLTAMLMQMNGLSKEDDIDPWLKRFDELDKDGSGTLDQEDLRLFAEEEEIRKQTRRDVRRLLEHKSRVKDMFSDLMMKRAGSMASLSMFPSDSEDEDEDEDEGGDTSGDLGGQADKDSNDGGNDGAQKEVIVGLEESWI